VAGLSYALAAVVVSFGLFALLHLRSTAELRRCEYGGVDELTGTPGLAAALHRNFGWWTLARLRHVGWQSVGLAISFAATVYTGLLTPHVPPSGLHPPPQQLPTLLLSTNNVCDFGGRFLALRVLRGSSQLGSASTSLQRWLQWLPFLIALLLVRLCLVGVGVAYCARGHSLEGHLARTTLSPPPPIAAEPGGSNLLMVALYAVGAFVGGASTVGLTQQAQSVCMSRSGPNLDESSVLPCPLAGQIMFLACIMGSVVGTLLPFP